MNDSRRFWVGCWKETNAQLGFNSRSAPKTARAKLMAVVALRIMQTAFYPSLPTRVRLFGLCSNVAHARA